MTTMPEKPFAGRSVDWQEGYQCGVDTFAAELKAARERGLLTEPRADAEPNDLGGPQGCPSHVGRTVGSIPATGASLQQRVLELLQSSSCYRGDVCGSLPCACAESIVWFFEKGARSMAKGDYLTKPMFGKPNDAIEQAAADWLEVHVGEYGEPVMRSLADLIKQHVSAGIRQTMDGAKGR